MRRVSRILAALAVLIGFGWSQGHAALTIDGTAKNIGTGVSSFTVTLSTTLTNDIIVVLGSCESAGGAVSVSSVSGGGLTWARRGTTFQYSNATPGGHIDVFWALAPSALSSTVITLTLSGTTDDCSAVAFGVNGANTTTPWDTNVSIPATASSAGSATPSVGGVSTTSANTMLLGFFGQGNGAAPTSPTAGTGYALVDPTNGCAPNGSGSFSSNACVQFQVVSSTQASVTVAFGSSVGGPQGIIADAIQQASGGGGATCVKGSLALMGAGC